MLRSESLQVVIQVRQVNEAQGRSEPALDPPGRLGNPTRSRLRRALRAFQSCRRPPKAGKRKFTQVAFDFRAYRVRAGINIEDLPAVSRIDRARRDGPISAGVHIEPPEKLGAGKLRFILAQ